MKYQFGTDYRQRAADLKAEARQLIDDNPDGLTDDALDRFEDLEREIQRAEEGIKDQEKLRKVLESGNYSLESGFAGGPPNVNKQRDPYEAPRHREAAHEVRSRAKAAIETWNAGDELRHTATETLERVGRDAAGNAERDIAGVAEHVLRYSHPDYISAFRKYSADPEGYLADFTPEENRAWREARQHQRAALDTSGAVLPSPLDPTIVLTNDGVVDPMRSAARVDTTVANEKRYILSAGSNFSYDAEGAETSDDTHSETEKTLTVVKAQGFIQATIEAWMDQPAFDTEVARLIADGKQRLEADKFITGAGSGSNEPNGIETALAGSGSEVNAAGEALVADDVYGLIEALPPRFRQSATWQLELSTRNFIHRLHNPSGSEPPLIEGNSLVGTPYVLNSSVDPYSSVDAGATASNRVLFVGDWSHYVILDRVGLSVYFVPPGRLLNTANNLPDGRVGWYAMWRHAADALTTSAFRMLDVETTA